MKNLRALAEQKISEIATVANGDGSVYFDTTDTIYTILDIIEMYEQELSIAEFESQVGGEEFEEIKRLFTEAMRPTESRVVMVVAGEG